MTNPRPPFPIHFGNQNYILEQYDRYKKGDREVDKELAAFFQGVDYAEGTGGEGEGGGWRVLLLIDAYVKQGHIQAKANPFSLSKGEKLFTRCRFTEGDLDRPFPTFNLLEEKEAPLKAIIDRLEEIYCQTTSYEYAHVVNEELYTWLHKAILERKKGEGKEEIAFIAKELYQANAFEDFLQKKFTGAKRFSLEGGEAFMPMIKEIFTLASLGGMVEGVIGMAHRGRLNVLCNLMEKPIDEVFSEFMGKSYPLKTTHMGDVKYHNGYANKVELRGSASIFLHLASNPSHLESVDPVMLGFTHARQRELGGKEKVLPLMVHGDASIAGQGVVYETMQLSKLAGYQVGGAIHIVINNQIGFTASSEETRSTRYCTDIAKTFGAPVIHVSAEDPIACFRAAKLAFEIRHRFHEDVFIDLNCHRLYGHNEADEPTFTNPKLYRLIKEKSSTYQEFIKERGEKRAIEEMEKGYQEKLHKAFEKAEKRAPFQEEEKREEEAPIQGVSEEKLSSYSRAITEIPKEFHPHPKIVKLFQTRRETLQNRGKVEWAAAELLAYASLLDEGISVRISGQDCRRGTFSHRHAVIIDQEHEKPYAPLSHVREGQGIFEAYNSALSEYAVMGYEFGFSLGMEKILPIWEAQFGDFANGAQIIVDQYLAGSETKWNQRSALTLFLPHGHEGMGPEHTSCRIERFLQLSGDANWSVVYPSTPAQFFHLIRRQALQKQKRPLIVATPKSMLRLSASFSDYDELIKGAFSPLLLDKNPPKEVRKLLLCTGKIFYELAEKRREGVAIVRIEQLYPFPAKQVKELSLKFPGSEVVWVQEEPENQGAWNYLAPLLTEHLGGKKVGVIARAANPVPDTGYLHLFKEEQERIIREAMQ